MESRQPTGRGVAGQRRMAREVAMKVLYQVDLGGMEAARALAETAEGEMLADDGLTFARELVDGTLAQQTTIDEHIAALSRAWAVSQMAAVDRAIMRLAAYEVLCREDIPVSASINEAVELAKKYSTPESGRFVNGVLGALARAMRGTRESVEPREPAEAPEPAGATEPEVE